MTTPEGLPFDAVDLFAGPGGWTKGLKRIGLRDFGVELDAAACATRYAAGFASWQQDVAEVGAATIRRLFAGVRGLIGSPPCPQFSSAGSGNGRRILDELRLAIRDAFAGEDFRRHLEPMAEVIYDGLVERGPRLCEAEALAAEALRAAREAALTVEPGRPAHRPTGPQEPREWRGAVRRGLGDGHARRGVGPAGLRGRLPVAGQPDRAVDPGRQRGPAWARRRDRRGCLVTSPQRVQRKRTNERPEVPS